MEERGMGAGCGAPTLEKAAEAGEREPQASGARMRQVGKGNVIVFLRNRETLKVERSRSIGPDGCIGPRTGHPDGYALTP